MIPLSCLNVALSFHYCVAHAPPGPALNEIRLVWPKFGICSAGTCPLNGILIILKVYFLSKMEHKECLQEYPIEEKMSRKKYLKKSTEHRNRDMEYACKKQKIPRKKNFLQPGE